MNNSADDLDGAPELQQAAAALGRLLAGLSIPVDAVVETVENIDVAEDGATVCVWMTIQDGRRALFQAKPGELPSFFVLER